LPKAWREITINFEPINSLVVFVFVKNTGIIHRLIDTSKSPICAEVGQGVLNYSPENRDY
jgi:hypothetical protein